MAGDYGLIVDVTLTADTIGPADQPANPPQSSINYDNYKQGVGALISHLNAHGHFNVMYDLQNEHTREETDPRTSTYRRGSWRTSWLTRRTSPTNPSLSRLNNPTAHPLRAMRPSILAKTPWPTTNRELPVGGETPGLS